MSETNTITPKMERLIEDLVKVMTPEEIRLFMMAIQEFRKELITTESQSRQTSSISRISPDAIVDEEQKRSQSDPLIVFSHGIDGLIDMKNDVKDMARQLGSLGRGIDNLVKTQGRNGQTPLYRFNNSRPRV